MLKSFEDLAKDVEIFHNNVLASNELTDTLDHLTAQLKESTTSFEEKSQCLSDKMDAMPGEIDVKNNSQAQLIKDSLDTELSKTVEAIRATNQEYSDLVRETNEEYSNLIRETNEEYSAQVREAHQAQVELIRETHQSQADLLRETYQEHLNTIRENQAKHEQLIMEENQKHSEKMQKIEEALELSEIDFNDKLDQISTSISEGNTENLSAIRTSVEEQLGNILKELQEEREKYTAEVQTLKTSIETAEKDAEAKYTSFVQKLEEINASGLYSNTLDINRKLDSQKTLIIVMGVLSIIATLSRFFI